MPGGRLIADTMAVPAIGAGGRCTVIVPQQPYDQRVSLYSSAVGLYISHKPFSLIGEGYAIPGQTEVHFDLPADEGLWALSAAGLIQVSRLICPNLQADATVAAIITAYLKSLGATQPAPVQSGGVIKRPSEFEKFNPFPAKSLKR